MNVSLKKNPVLTGALLLTLSGFFCRLLGFFYRIYLSRAIGAEKLGLYHMLFPVYILCLSLCAGSVQTAISKLTASRNAAGAKKVLRVGLFFSLSIAIVLTYTVRRASSLIACQLMKEPDLTSLLPVMALSIPCAAVHACICGYFYGRQRAVWPAAAQIAEQFFRMAAVWIFFTYGHFGNNDEPVFPVVLGLLAGETMSALICILLFMRFHDKGDNSWPEPFPRIFCSLLSLFLPLMGSRFLISLLQSAEAVWIPACLQQSGLARSEAYRILGTLNGMALPFILFPSAIINSVSLLLLPRVSDAQARGDAESITESILMSLRCSLCLGILCIGIFTMFGTRLGILVFSNVQAGIYIRVLAWICPFLYLSSTTGSILNGLGHTGITFEHHLITLMLRLAFVLLGIPSLGIYAYLCGLLASELLLAALHLFALKTYLLSGLPPVRIIVFPMISIVLSAGICISFSAFCGKSEKIPRIFQTGGEILFFCFCYIAFLFLFEQWHPANCDR